MKRASGIELPALWARSLGLEQSLEPFYSPTTAVIVKATPIKGLHRSRVSAACSTRLESCFNSACFDGSICKRQAGVSFQIMRCASPILAGSLAATAIQRTALPFPSSLDHARTLVKAHGSEAAKAFPEWHCAAPSCSGNNGEGAI